MKAITIYDDEEFLRQISKEVDINDEDLLNDIKILDLDIINKMQEDTATEDDEKYNEARVLINPVVKLREGLTEYWEACASCLNNTGLVKRPYKILVDYIDLNGEKHEDVFEGFESTVLSHELDHLDGVLHIDIAEKVLVLDVDERKKLRQKEGYKVLSKTGSYNKLNKIN